MKALIEKNQLADAVRIVSGVISSRVTLPVLSNLCLKSEPDRLRFIATDLDITITTAVPAVVETQGALTVPAKKLAAIAAALPDGEIELDANNKDVLRILKDSSDFKLRGLSVDQFPPERKPSADAKRFTIDQAVLKTMLAKTAYAISTDESRYVLTGILFEFDGATLNLIATDGRRLSRATHPLAVAFAEPKRKIGFILPSRAVVELSRLLADKGSADIAFTDNSVTVALTGDAGEITLHSKLIEGNFPNYRQVIPGEPKHVISIARADLLAAVRAADLFTSDKSNSVKLAFSKNQLAITAKSMDIGESLLTVDVKFKGKDLAIAFNPVYLVEPLRSLDDDDIQLSLIDELSPGVISTLDGALTCVVMPMRLDGGPVVATPETTKKEQKQNANQPEQPEPAAVG